MQFLLLVFINILMACFFYLILRLKLEKYASDYREKRLKREMDEIINEFNETAERNITILDNRIETIKTLLKKSGIIDCIDINIDDHSDERSKNKVISTQQHIIPSHTKKHDKEPYIEENTEADLNLKTDTKTVKVYNNGFLIKLASNVKNSIQRNYKSIFHSRSYELNNSSTENYIDNNTPDEIPSDLSSGAKHTKEKIDIIIDYSHKSLNLKSENNFETAVPALQEAEDTTDLAVDCRENRPLIDNERLSEYELENMFYTSKDKYLLISELYEKGYPADLISRSSGIPIGEIKLVVDLNKSL